ncbi:MAG: SsrA-binding protein SmpB [Phycisphaerae bacterium]|nr:SsrA-binding protein SmpB [Phycisphaerae bacterium]
MAKKKQKSSRPPRIENRRARYDYHVEAVVECGIELTGTEVKSLRAGKASVDDAHGRVRDGEVWLVGADIAQYPQAAGTLQHEPTRSRKLLVHRRQIAQLAAHAEQKGRTLVPLKIYFKRGWAKVELGLVVGKRAYDKREKLKRRQQKRDIDREMRRYGSR